MPRSRPQRRPIRLPAYDYASPGAYFVTVCTAGRVCFLGSIVEDASRLDAVGRLVEREWVALPTRFPYLELDAFVVMPNHLHGIVVLRAGQAPPLPVVVGSFKSGCSRHAGRALWQRGFHERVIRDERELARIRQYVAENPLRWALDRENPDRGNPAPGVSDRASPTPDRAYPGHGAPDCVYPAGAASVGAYPAGAAFVRTYPAPDRLPL
jgi:REP element-mobilizing transposase RayT